MIAKKIALSMYLALIILSMENVILGAGKLVCESVSPNLSTFTSIRIAPASLASGPTRYDTVGNVI